METLYWIFEYGKVLWGYMFFMFLWPSVVFSKHLRSKDKVYRFSFCVLAQVIIACYIFNQFFKKTEFSISVGIVS